MTKLLISGGDGKFAKQIIKYNNEYEIAAPSRIEMDITNFEDVVDFVSKFKPDIFLHPAAYTRPMKKHQERPDLSIKTNIIGTCNVVLACIKYDIKLVYISTDYVYPGIDGDYNEDSALSPYVGNNDGVTKYGWSKLGGEAAVRMYDNSLILRTCMCNFPFPHKNAAIDIKKSLIFDYEAAEITLKLLNEYGIINVGGKSRSVFDFAISHNPETGAISRKDIKDVKIAPNTTMNVNKMMKILEVNSDKG